VGGRDGESAEARQSCQEREHKSLCEVQEEEQAVTEPGQVEEQGQRPGEVEWERVERRRFVLVAV